MARNNLGVILHVVPVVKQAFYAFSASDDLATLRKIPAGGIVLELPPDPQSGDKYGFADLDGSCSSASPITIAAGGGTSLRGSAAISSTSAYAAGTLTYDETSSSWALSDEGAHAGALITTPTTWTVDPQDSTGSASDKNPGTSSLPLLTIARLNAALAYAKVRAALVVNILGDVVAGDAPLDLSTVSLQTAAGGSMTFNGTRQVEHAGTLSAVTAMNPATNQRQVLGDTALGSNGWQPFEGELLVDTTAGSNLGNTCRIAQHVASTATTDAGPVYNTATNPATLTVGDTYQIVRGSELRVAFGNPTLDDALEGLANPDVVVWNNFDFVSLGSPDYVFAQFGSGQANYCRFFDPLQVIGSARLECFMCCAGGTLGIFTYPTAAFQIAELSATALFFGCLLYITGQEYAAGSYLPESSGHTYLCANGSATNGVAYFFQPGQLQIFEDVQVQDMIKNTIEEAGGQLNLRQGCQLEAQFGYLWGTSSGSVYGMYLYPHCDVRVAGDPFATLTGNEGDWIYGGTLAQSHAWNGTAYTAGLANTWALFYEAVGSGGMNVGGVSNAHDLLGNTHIFGGN